MNSIQHRIKVIRLSFSMDSGERWITVHPNGKEGSGRPALIDDKGIVKAGMGGKFNGRHISQAHKNGITEKEEPKKDEKKKYNILKDSHVYIETPIKVKKDEVWKGEYLLDHPSTEGGRVRGSHLTIKNGYAIGMHENLAKNLGIKTIGNPSGQVEKKDKKELLRESKDLESGIWSLNNSIDHNLTRWSAEKLRSKIKELDEYKNKLNEVRGLLGFRVKRKERIISSNGETANQRFNRLVDMHNVMANEHNKIVRDYQNAKNIGSSISKQEIRDMLLRILKSKKDIDRISRQRLAAKKAALEEDKMNYIKRKLASEPEESSKS